MNHKIYARVYNGTLWIRRDNYFKGYPIKNHNLVAVEACYSTASYIPPETLFNVADQIFFFKHSDSVKRFKA